MAGKSAGNAAGRTARRASTLLIIDEYAEVTDRAAMLAALRVILGLPAQTPAFQPVPIVQRALQPLAPAAAAAATAAAADAREEEARHYTYAHTNDDAQHASA